MLPRHRLCGAWCRTCSRSIAWKLRTIVFIFMALVDDTSSLVESSDAARSVLSCGGFVWRTMRNSPICTHVTQVFRERAAAFLSVMKPQRQR